MTVQDIALALAGVLGGGVAIIHGVIVHKLMVRPMAAAPGLRMSGAVRRLVPPLLQFSTFNWALGGAALVAAGFWLQPEARLMTALLVGGSYLFAAVANCWGTRGRHPGWALYTAALGLIVFGVSGGGA